MINESTITKLVEMKLNSLADIYRSQLMDNSYNDLSFEEKHNVIILGATGSGKTFISSALGIAACRNFYTVKYIRLPDLLNGLSVARSEGIYQRVMKQYKKFSLLIIDECLLVALTPTESRDLLDIIEARHKKSSTIFSSQISTEG